jgi:hypothetical protein
MFKSCSKTTRELHMAFQSLLTIIHTHQEALAICGSYGGIEQLALQIPFNTIARGLGYLDKL